MTKHQAGKQNGRVASGVLVVIKYTEPKAYPNAIGTRELRRTNFSVPSPRMSRVNESPYIVSAYSSYVEERALRQVKNICLNSLIC